MNLEILTMILSAITLLFYLEPIINDEIKHIQYKLFSNIKQTH